MDKLNNSPTNVQKSYFRLAAPYPHAQALLQDLQEKFSLTPTTWQQLLWHGGLYINKKRYHQEQHISEDFITFNQQDTEIWLYLFKSAPQPLKITFNEILYLDDHLVVVHKPAGLPMQGSRASSKISLEQAVKDLLGDPHIRAIHRLDTATSGVCLFARDRETLRALSKAFAKQRIHKTYLALVAEERLAELKPELKIDYDHPTFSVAGYLYPAPNPLKIPHAYFQLSHEDLPLGKWSVTNFKLLAQEPPYALFQAEPLTGRTHQIRVHLQSLGLPLSGDRLYGDPLPPATATGLKLHAYRLTFNYPGLKDLITFTAKLPPTWPAVFAKYLE